MPWPRHVNVGTTAWPAGRLQPEWTGVRTVRLDQAFSRVLAAWPGGADPTQHNWTRPVADDVATPCRIDCVTAASQFPALGDDEAYRLLVDASGVSIVAATEWGALRALSTLQQLPLRHQNGWSLPEVTIDDAPRFPWRGVMLDPARHFLPLHALLRTLDAMAFFKLNVLHLHLTDDQGFRFPSARFPRLTELGGSGEHYRRDELETLVRHAAARGIRVVPELDMPGHCSSWLAAYPQWGARDTAVGSARAFGVHAAALDPTRDAVFEAIAELLAEVTEIFPDSHVHVGGDEVDPTWWNESADIQRYMRANDIEDTRSLQAAFTNRIGHILDGLGKHMIGWDEIRGPLLDTDAVVQSWRGAHSRDGALAEGFDCVVSAGFYLDLFYPADLHYQVDPAAPPAAQAAQERALKDDPRLGHARAGLEWMERFTRDAGIVGDTAPPGERRRAGKGPKHTGARSDTDEVSGQVLGGEACLWGELVDESLLDIRLWSRLPAIAERLWSPATSIDIDDMYERLSATQKRLADATGVDLAAAQARLFAAMGLDAGDYAAIRPLLDVLEPVKWYARLLGREGLEARVAGMAVSTERPYNVETPLDRTVDYLPPESLHARDFSRRVDILLADPARMDVRDKLTACADNWRRLPAVISELQSKAPQLAETAPLAERLGTLADLLCRALASLPAGLTPGERADADAALSRIEEPAAELVIAVVPALRRLLDGATDTSHPDAAP